MREIKFRVWNEREKTYEDGWNYFISDEGELYALKYGALIGMSGVDYLKVERPTGLIDKNCKDIYEGDIVDYNDDGECIGVVIYDAPEFYLDADATNWVRMFLKGAPHQRVIGNIHENPELLGD